MHTVITSILGVGIPVIEIAVNDDIKKTISNITYENTIILIAIALMTITFIAIYSSHKKIKYFLSIFMISILGGNLITLVILTVFDLITYPNLENMENVKAFLLQIARFAAIPSIGISIGLFTKPIKDIEDNKSN